MCTELPDFRFVASHTRLELHNYEACVPETSSLCHPTLNMPIAKDKFSKGDEWNEALSSNNNHTI